ncbi:MAG: hypothetical protein LBR90_02755 [Elusimicrobiota bacterium]|jgi:processive 1,2-diacylglycerol beta-glucosyltransferase|nr:hypothetical protein [Elusimicrobiota bacterium]
MNKNKKVLILTSFVTGHGHASITRAVEDALKAQGADFKTIEAFELCRPKAWFKGAKGYGKLTNNHPKLWEFLFNLSHVLHRLSAFILQLSCEKGFLKIYQDYRPDVIVTVHPMFVGGILNILEKRKINIPFVSLVADLVSISNLWADKRAALTICPTRECLAFMLRRGLRPQKLSVINLPTRTKITERALEITAPDKQDGGPVKLFVMSGAEGSGGLDSNIRELLKIDNTSVTLVAGRNAALEKSLRAEFAGDTRVEIHGFVDNIEQLIPRHDIAVVRGSPNSLMECVNLCVPVIVKGYLGGQEPGNVDFIITRRLGVFCYETAQLAYFVRQYLQDERKLLKQTRQNQFNFRDLKAAQKIAAEIVQI